MARESSEFCGFLESYAEINSAPDTRSGPWVESLAEYDPPPPGGCMGSLQEDDSLRLPIRFGSGARPAEKKSPHTEV